MIYADVMGWINLSYPFCVRLVLTIRGQIFPRSAIYMHVFVVELFPTLQEIHELYMNSTICYVNALASARRIGAFAGDG